MRRKQLWCAVLALGVSVGAVMLVACGTTAEEIAGMTAVAATDTPLPTDTPEPTATPVPDPAIGEELYHKAFAETSARPCSQCHPLTEGGNAPGWSLVGISERAGERVEGMSAEEYLRESIIDPSAYVVEGWPDNRMPQNYGDFLSEEDVDNLVAFLLTQ